MSYRSFLTSSKPIIADLQARQEWGQIERLYQTTSRWALTINLPLVLIMILFPKQILAIFGQSFVGGANALVILACAEFINVITGTSGPIIDMTGLNRLKMANSILVVTVSIGANVLFIPMWGLIGAAAAAFVSVAVINSARMIEVYVLYRLLPYNRTLLKPLVAGLAAVAAALLLRNWYPGSQNLIYLVIGATFVLGVYALALAALGLPPEDRLVLNRAFQHAGRLVDRGRAVFRRDYAVKSSLD
jgi:O-antigen/teichoic acid export membrane protein